MTKSPPKKRAASKKPAVAGSTKSGATKDRELSQALLKIQDLNSLISRQDHQIAVQQGKIIRLEEQLKLMEAISREVDNRKVEASSQPSGQAYDSLFGGQAKPVPAPRYDRQHSKPAGNGDRSEMAEKAMRYCRYYGVTTVDAQVLKNWEG